MKAYRAKISFVILIALLSDFCLAGTFRLTRSENIRFNLGDAGYDTNLLDTVTTLPAGTVIEVDDAALRHPVMTPYRCNPATERRCDPSVPRYASYGFIGNVRIVSIPTWSAQGRRALWQVRRFFRAGGDRLSLYFSRATLAYGTRRIYADGARTGLRFSRPTPIYGRARGTGYEDDPAEASLYRAAREAGRIGNAMPGDSQARCEQETSSSDPARDSGDMGRDPGGESRPDPALAWRRWLSAYSSRPDVRAMLSALWRNHRPSFTFQCYRYLKTALYQSGMVPRGALNTRGIDANASSAVPRLREFGFINLLDYARFQYLRDNPDLAPVGAIVVYGGDHSAPQYVPGDVQVRDARGWISDYFSQHALTHQWNGRHFRVIGVMVKAAQ